MPNCRETPARSNNLYLMRISLRRAVHFAVTSKISRAILNRQATHTHIFPNNAGSNNPLLLSPPSPDKPDTRKAVPAQHSFNLWTTRQTEDSVLLQGLDGVKRPSSPSRPPPSYYCSLDDGNQLRLHGKPNADFTSSVRSARYGEVWPHRVSVPCLGRQTR